MRNAYSVAMDPKLGDIANGDVHMRDGALVAVGANLKAAGAEVIDGRNRIACPGFTDTHFHPRGSFARGMMAETKTLNSIASYTASRLASGLPYLGDLLKRGVQ